MSILDSFTQQDEEEFFRGSLLPASRYKSNGQALLKHLMSMYLPTSKESVVELFPKLVPEDFYIDSKIYFSLRAQEFRFKNDIMTCFLQFVKGYDKFKSSDGDLRVTRELKGLTYKFTYGNDIYVSDKLILHSFLYHSIWLTGDIYSVINDKDSNILRDIPLYPLRGEADDGQMKIMVDAIQAIDAVEEKSNLNVLIVGSSHEPGIIARSAYYPIFFQIKNSKVRMYDPNEEESVQCINTNIITRVKGYYDYNDLGTYDVILDDSWSSGSSRMEDYLLTHTYEDFIKDYPSHYSLKSFRQLIDGKYYYQVVRTSSKEVRYVSRPILPTINISLVSKLGSCSFCRELMYTLVGTYCDEFFYHINNNHKHSDGMGPLVISKGWRQKLYPVRWEETAYVPSKMYRLYSDSSGLVEEYDAIEARQEYIFGKDIIVSSEVFITNLVALMSNRVFKYKGDVLMEAYPSFFFEWKHVKEKIEGASLYFSGGQYDYSHYLKDANRLEFSSYANLILHNKDEINSIRPFDYTSFRTIRAGDYSFVRQFRVDSEPRDFITDMVNSRKLSPHAMYTLTKMERISRNLEQSYVKSNHSYLSYIQYVDHVNEKRKLKEQQILERRTKILEKYKQLDDTV